MRAKLGWLVVALCLLAAVVFWLDARRARREATKAGLARANAEAIHDTTRVVDSAALAAVRRAYGDSMTAVTRLAEQRALEATALDRALAVERRTTASLRLTIDTLRDSGRVVVRVDSTDTRTASFTARHGPIAVTADVTLPPPPATGSWRLTAALDDAHLTTSVACGEPDATGIRAASVTIVGPDWLHVRVDSARQDPAVCNRAPASSGRRWHLGVAAGYGPTIMTDGRAHLGWTALVGVVVPVF